MRYLIALILAVAVAAQVSAFDLGAAAPDKPVSHHQPPPPDPEVIRQGGDTILDATFVTLPVVNMTGTTAGYNNDYDEQCPFGSPSPDVVYTFVPDVTVTIHLDLYGSTYDTKIYVYDENLNLVGCNDDFYPDYVSFLGYVTVMGGAQYFVVIDGYGGDSGDYVLNIEEYIPCVLDCPTGAELENEPPLENEYVDNWNGGCNTEGSTPFQPITGEWFCGVSGFYMFAGSPYRDTDWFEIMIPEGGVLEITGDAELASWMFELSPLDCDSVGVAQQMGIGPCTEGTLTIAGTAGSTIWFWVGSQTFLNPDGSDVYEYDYVLHTNIPGSVAIENRSFSDVKSLFR